MDRRLGLLDRWQQLRAGDEPRAAAVGHERPRPADEDDDPVREADQIEDVDAEPQQPGGEAALAPERPEPRDVGDARQPPDDGDVAVVAVAERLVRPAEDAPADDLRRVSRRPASRPGPRPASACPASTAPRPRRRRRRSPGGRGSSGPARRSPGRRGRSAAPVAAATVRAKRAVRTPAAHSTVRDGIHSSAPSGPVDADPGLVEVDDPRPGPDLHAQPLELALGRGRPIRRIRRQDPVHRLDQHDPRLARADRPEVAPERVVGDLAERPAELDPGRSATDDARTSSRHAGARGRPRARRPRRRSGSGAGSRSRPRWS